MLNLNLINESRALEVVVGPTKLRSEVRSENPQNLDQNDGTLVTFLRDNSVTYPAALMG